MVEIYRFAATFLIAYRSGRWAYFYRQQKMSQALLADCDFRARAICLIPENSTMIIPIDDDRALRERLQAVEDDAGRRAPRDPSKGEL